MNENPEGATNPLNPNPAAGATPAAGAATPTAPVQPAPAQPVAPAAAQPVAPINAMPVMPVAGASAAPAAAPMAPATPTQPAMPAQPVIPAQPESPAQPVAPVTSPTPGQAMDFVNPAATNPAAAQPAQPAVAQSTGSTAEEALAAALNETQATTEQPMPVAQDSVVEPAKKSKKKTPMLIAIILVGVAVICGLAAVLVMMLNQEDDHVALALEQAFSADAAKELGIDGTITIQNDDENALVPRVKIDINGAIDTSTGVNSAQAKLTATLASETTMEFELDEVRVEDGDTFIRVSGVQAAMEAMLSDQPTCTTLEDGTEQCTAATTEIEQCDDAGNCVTIVESVEAVDLSGVYDALLNMLGTVDGEWLQFPANRAENEDNSGLDDVLDLSSQVCMVRMIGSLSNYGGTIGQLYNQNAFITSSTDNVKITAKSNNGMVYRIGFDDNKLANFTTGLNNSQFGQAYRDCSGDTLPTMGSLFYTMPPRIEVEVNKDTNRFTRVYFDATLKDETTSVTADLTISYPGTVTVDAPAEYVNGQTMLTDMFSQFFNVEIIEGETVEETTE